MPGIKISGKIGGRTLQVDTGEDMSWVKAFDMAAGITDVFRRAEVCDVCGKTDINLVAFSSKEKDNRIIKLQCKCGASLMVHFSKAGGIYTVDKEKYTKFTPNQGFADKPVDDTTFPD